jgi:hypothetical protein
VTREELCRTLWAEDTFVDFETPLNVAINKVRQALRALLFLYKAVLLIEIETLPPIVRARMTYLHVMQRGALGVRSPLDQL